MGGIIDQLREFVNEHRCKIVIDTLYFVNGDCKIGYNDAKHIIEVVDSLRLTVGSLQEEYQECKYLNRLLIKENLELQAQLTNKN